MLASSAKKEKHAKIALQEPIATLQEPQLVLIAPQDSPVFQVLMKLQTVSSALQDNIVMRMVSVEIVHLENSAMFLAHQAV